MPRPSCPRRYTTTPRPSAAIIFSAGLAGDVAHDEGDVLASVDEVAIADGGELALLERDARLGDADHQALAAAPVGDQVGDGDDEQAVLLGERDQARHARHLAVALGDLADD